MRVILFPVLTLLLFAVNSAGARPDFSSRIDKLFTSYIDSGFAGSVLVEKENTVVFVGDLYLWISAYQNKNFMPEEFTSKIFYDYVPEDTYSWNKSKTAHRTRFYHKGGGHPDFETRMMWYPDDNILVIFCINNDYNLARKLFNQVSGLIN